MNIYNFIGRLGRYILIVSFLLTVFDYVQDSILEEVAIDLVQELQGEFSIQLDQLDVKIALNDNSFMLKIEALSEEA